MTDPRKALIVRIRKCLALAASANEHEAALALEKAQALMAEHGVSAEDVALADVAEALATGGGARRPPRWENNLAATIACAMECRVIYEERRAGWEWACRWRFVGVGAAAEIAGYAWSVLYRQLRRQRQEYIGRALRRCKPARKRERADVFCEAWGEAVWAKVRHLNPSPARMALIQRHIDAAGEQLVKLDDRAASTALSGALANDYWRGRAAGRSAELNAGVGTAGTKLLG